jgi:hypothetical protein
MRCGARALLFVLCHAWCGVASARAQGSVGKTDSVLPHLHRALGLPWHDVRLGMRLDTVRARAMGLRPTLASFEHQVWTTFPRSDSVEVVVTVKSDVTTQANPDPTLAAVSVDLSTGDERKFLHAFRLIQQSLRSLPAPALCERDSVIGYRGTALHVMFKARWSDSVTAVGLSASVPRRGPKQRGKPGVDEYHLHFSVWRRGDPQIGMSQVSQRQKACRFDAATLRALRKRISADSLRLLTPRLGPPIGRDTTRR